MQRQGIPLKPDFSARRTGGPLIKAAAIALSAFANKTHICTELRNWRVSKDIETIIKAAVSPATLTQADWAGSLAATAGADVLNVVLAPAYASAELLKRGLQLEFGRNRAITVPGIVADSSGTSFVGEAQAIPLRQFSFSGGPQLSPHKLATLSEFTHETFEHSQPTIEALVKYTLTRHVGLKLDEVMFSTGAGDSV